MNLYCLHILVLTILRLITLWTYVITIRHIILRILILLRLDTTDIDPKAHDKKKGQKTDPTYNVGENFADGKVKGKSRPGRVKRSGASCDGSVSDLRSKAKNASGERAKMYHWCTNMKSGRNK